MAGPINTARSFVLASLLALVGACSNESAPRPGYTKIDDMEGDNGSFGWMAPSGMVSGSWYSTTDCTEADRIAPPPSFVYPQAWTYAVLSMPHETLPGITSLHAARLRTISPLVGVWGASIGIDLATPPSGHGGGGEAPADAGAPTMGQPCKQGSALDFPAISLDLTTYSGVTFWARADNVGAKTVRVQVRDKDVDPRGGICNAADPSSDVGCYNDFFTTVTLTDTLTQYTVDFSSLRQDPSWGYRPDPSVLDLQQVYTLTFQVNSPSACMSGSNAMCAGGNMPALAFDFWIDDLYLVSK